MKKTLRMDADAVLSCSVYISFCLFFFLQERVIHMSFRTFICEMCPVPVHNIAPKFHNTVPISARVVLTNGNRFHHTDWKYRWALFPSPSRSFNSNFYRIRIIFTIEAHGFWNHIESSIRNDACHGNRATKCFTNIMLQYRKTLLLSSVFRGPC